MAFSMVCNNKGCGEHMEPYLDKDTDKVHCSCCDKEITNVTHFVKAQMKSLKQFRQKKAISFSVKCNFCSKEDRPIIVKDDILCSFCKKAHTHLSEPFKHMLKDNLKKATQDI